MKKILCFGEALVDLRSNTLEDHHATQQTFSKFAGGAPANVCVAALCQQPHKLSPTIEFASLCGAHAASRKGAFIPLRSQQSLAEFRNSL